MENARTRPSELAPETPDELRALLRFLNSRPIGYEPEGLPDARSAAPFLEACGFELGGAGLDDDDLAALCELRGALVTVLDKGRSTDEHEEAWERINTLAAVSPVVIAFSPGPFAALEPTGIGAQAVIERVLADTHAAIEDGRFGRVRLCAFEPCSGAFYDATRSRTQRWHSYATCGNRVNVAAHRERVQRASAS
jgi:CGNR zinc finger/Putative stress-induced transcription regulator